MRIGKNGRKLRIGKRNPNGIDESKAMEEYLEALRICYGDFLEIERETRETVKQTSLWQVYMALEAAITALDEATDFLAALPYTPFLVTFHQSGGSV